MSSEPVTAADVEGARVDVTRLRIDPRALTGEIDVDAIEADISILAARPRHHATEPAALEAGVEHIRGELEATGLPVHEVLTEYEGYETPALYATLAGTECPDRVIVLGAHYDTVAGPPGADDNASGVAAMLELARALADTPLPATVVFAAFPFEELGPPWLGSSAVADQFLDGGDEVIGMVSLEMIGYTDPGPDQLFDGPADYIAYLGNLESAPLVHTFEAAALVWAASAPPVQAHSLDPQAVPDIARSDHVAFWDRDTPAFMATDTANLRNPHYHEPSDTVDELDLEFATAVTQALAAGTVAYASVDTDGSGTPDACQSGAPTVRN